MIPGFQDLMRPMLVAASDGQEWHVRDLRERLAEDLGLTDDELAESLPSGDLTFRNRVGWACSYLFHTRLLERPRRGVYRITERGRRVLAENPGRVDLAVLSQFEELELLRGAHRTQVERGPRTVDEENLTPIEEIEVASAELRSALAAELLAQIAAQSPEFFERLVLDLLTAMGYGGRRQDPARHMGRSGDEGIDGVIQEDRLGLDQIYVQAKRWQSAVGRPDIQRFVGALHGQRASKGVFITTSVFSREATEYAANVTPRVILVDGQRLAGLMIDFDIGVSLDRRIDLKRIDSDYFSSEDA